MHSEVEVGVQEDGRLGRVRRSGGFVVGSGDRKKLRGVGRELYYGITQSQTAPPADCTRLPAQ